MTTARATCTECGQPKYTTSTGLIRSHRIRTSVCGGSFKYPVEGPPPGQQASTDASHLPLPDEPTYGRSCDGGHCDAPSIGWRWYRDQKTWLPVCGQHMDGPPGRSRIYDQQGDQP